MRKTDENGTVSRLLNGYADALGMRFFYCVTIFFLAVFLTVQYVFSSFTVIFVSGSSMEPTLSNGDYLVMEVREEYHRGDIVIVDHKTASGSTIVIKRLIAVGGDSFYCERGQLYLQKQGETEFTLQAEDYVKDGWFNHYDIPLTTLAEDEIFYMGDNRNVSKDCREYGPVKAEYIMGAIPDWAIEHRSVIGFMQKYRIFDTKGESI